MLAVQAGGPEFNSEHPKLGMGFELITPTPGRWGQAVPGSQSMSQAMGLSKQGGGQEKSMPEIDFWLVCVFVCGVYVCICGCVLGHTPTSTPASDLDRLLSA